MAVSSLEYTITPLQHSLHTQCRACTTMPKDLGTILWKTISPELHFAPIAPQAWWQADRGKVSFAMRELISVS